MTHDDILNRPYLSFELPNEDIRTLVMRLRRSVGSLRMIGAKADVTRQRQAQEALTRREAEFATPADNMAQLAWMTRPDGHIYWYNKRWYDHTGTTLAEMEGWGWEKIHHPDHIDGVVAFVTDAWAANKSFELTFPQRGQDGQYRWFFTRAEPICSEQGELLRWLGTNTDVTEMRQLQLTHSYADLAHQVQVLRQQLGQA